MQPQPHLLPSLYSLLNQIIDYAGLFPPANLPLKEAIQNYIRYQTWPQSWMLSRFILPTTRMAELSGLIDAGLTWDGSLTFSVLGQGGEDRNGFLAGLEADVQAVIQFRERYGHRVCIDVYEARLPASGFEDTQQTHSLLKETVAHLQEEGLSPFFEAPFGNGWEARVQGLIQAIDALPSALRAGFKLRTGGVTANAFPSPGQVALALCACRDHQLPLKCTAGLHHPIRSYRAEVGTKMHGFVNVFVAGVFAKAYALNTDGVVRILEEEDPDRFGFDRAGIRWGELGVSVEQIESVRKNQMISFGCCSFEEPINDLLSLGFGLMKS